MDPGWRLPKVRRTDLRADGMVVGDASTAEILVRMRSGAKPVHHDNDVAHMRMLRCALRHLADDWAIFPIKPRGKEPLTRNGCKATLRLFWVHLGCRRLREASTSSLATRLSAIRNWPLSNRGKRTRFRSASVSSRPATLPWARLRNAFSPAVPLTSNT